MDDLVKTLKEELGKIPKSVLEKINNFAIENNRKRDLKIQAVYFHPNHDSGQGMIYFITEPHEYLDELEDEVINLDLDITRTDNISLDVMEWPCGYDGIEDQGFFKELCLFDYVKGRAA